jgi:hypothetical protein
MNTISDYFIIVGVFIVFLVVSSLLYGILYALYEIRDAIKNLCDGIKIRTGFTEKVSIDIPPIQVEGPTAEWIHGHRGEDVDRVCSNCGAKEPEEPHNKYCPDCKCKMIF